MYKIPTLQCARHCSRLHEGTGHIKILAPCISWWSMKKVLYAYGGIPRKQTVWLEGK